MFKERTRNCSCWFPSHAHYWISSKILFVSCSYKRNAW